jgi:hypothetical protein
MIFCLSGSACRRREAAEPSRGWPSMDQAIECLRSIGPQRLKNTLIDGTTQNI